MAKICGIYQIKNKVNNKIYIGSSKDIKQRWAKHKHELINGIHANKHLLTSVQKYGLKNFEFIILEEVCESIKLIEREQYYIDLLEPYKNSIGYNKRLKAESNLGYKCTEEQREKIRHASTGRKHTEETKLKISKIHKGKKLSDETKDKIRATRTGKTGWWRGRKRSEEQRTKISEIAKKRIGETNPNAKIKNEQVELIKNMFYKEKIKINEIAKFFSVSRSTIKRILHDKRKQIE